MAVWKMGIFQLVITLWIQSEGMFQDLGFVDGERVASDCCC